MRYFSLFILSFAFNNTFCQDTLFTGEKDWTEENEKAVITEGFSQEKFPVPNKSKDLSYLMPPAGKQGTQGSCWAWATTYAMRSSMDNPGRPNYFLDGNGKLDSNKVYSPSYTYQYYKGNKNDCEFGSFSAQVLDSVLKNGAVGFKLLPYNERRCNFTISDTLNKLARNKSKDGYDVFYLKDLYSAKVVLASGQPLVISMRIGSGFSNLRSIKYTGQPIIYKNFGSRKGNHAMVCVGYDDSLNAVKVLNSWGDDWAMNGYCWIDYNIIEQSANYFCYPKKRFVPENKVTQKEDAKEKVVEKSSWPSSELLSAWFKEGYFVRFGKYKIALADLNTSTKTALIEIRDSDYNLIKNFPVQENATANFYIGDQLYTFSLDDIAHRGKNFFTKAVVFTISKAKREADQ